MSLMKTRTAKLILENGNIWVSLRDLPLSWLATCFLVKKIKQRLPMAENHLVQVKELFHRYDSDSDNSLSLNELFILLEDIGNQITSLPATAQVASQQGKYLGKKLHRISLAPDLPPPQDAPSLYPSYGVLHALSDEAFSAPFNYFHLGTLAYIGNGAVFDFGKYSYMGGLAAMYAWRSTYWNEQLSPRTRALVMIDWIIRCVIICTNLKNY
jgi:NADH dehydrogenase